jgi:hypothetical protein
MKFLTSILTSISLATTLYSMDISNIGDGEIIIDTPENSELLNSIESAETFPMDIDTQVDNSPMIVEDIASNYQPIEVKKVGNRVLHTRKEVRVINNKKYIKYQNISDGKIIIESANTKELLDSIPTAKTYPLDYNGEAVESVKTTLTTNNTTNNTTNYQKVSSLPKDNTKKNSQSGNYGTIHGKVKLLHVIDGKDNGYDINTGSTYYTSVNYTTPKVNGFSATVGGYVVGDTGLTDTDKKAMIANGQFMGKKTKDKTTILDTKKGIEEAYVKYSANGLKAQAGHMKLNTPMTKNSISTVANLYEGAVVSSKNIAKDTTLVGAHITKMAYGARAISDFGKIGEKTTTAGSVGVLSVDEQEIAELSAGDQSLPKKIRRGKFTNLGKIAGKDDSNGMTIVGAINRSIKNTTLQGWEYFIYDVANVTYVDGMTKFKLANGVKTMLGAQLLHENLKDSDDTPLLVGVKGGISYKNAKFIVAVNRSNGDTMLNIWGGDPAYTSMLYSKNAYRPDVTAVKFVGNYKIPDFNGALPKNLFLSLAHGRFSQSSLKNTQTDATETDIALKYKPRKDLVVKLVNVQRKSEFDGYKGKDKTQNVVKLVMQYLF